MAGYKIFVSYNHREDQRWCNELIPWLATMLKTSKAEIWWDRELLIGDNFEDLIKSRIDDSRLAILLISSGFLKPDGFIMNVEWPRDKFFEEVCLAVA